MNSTGSTGSTVLGDSSAKGVSKYFHSIPAYTQFSVAYIYLLD